MLSIQIASFEQLHFVRDLAKTIWPKTFADILTPDQITFMMNWMYALETLEKQHQEGQIFLLVFEDDKHIGFAAYETNIKNSGKTKIHKLYIDQQVQGKGVGRMVIEFIENAARQNKQTHLTLNVNRFNQKAIDFYFRVGFVEAYREVIDIGNGFVMDDVVMEKEVGK